MRIIAIDPDVDASGWCVVNTDGDIPLLTSKTLWEIFNSLDNLCMGEHIVIIEAGWIDKNGKESKNKSYHTGGKGSSYDVGRNSEIGRQIEKFCKAKGINYRLEIPKGYSNSKIYSHEVFISITGWRHIKKTNQDTRVAGMFAYNEWSKQKMLSKTKK